MNTDRIISTMRTDHTGILINFRMNPTLQMNKEDLLQETVIRMCELSEKGGKNANAKSG